jgi:methanogenic corrinoid protein MtbC1
MNDVSGFRQHGVPAEMVETFSHLLFSPDDSDAWAMVEQLLADGISAETLMLSLLAPSARLMGDLWCSDRVGFVEVTVGLSRLQQYLRRFGSGVGAPLEKGRALLAPVPGEQHTFGLRVVEEFLLRDGWQVNTCIAPSEAAIGALVAADAYDFVGFSISGERLLPALRSAIRKVRSASRNHGIRVMAGGALFAGPLSASACDADATVTDAGQAVAQANEWYALAGVM